MTNWPSEQLDRTAQNSNYTCQSSENTVGSGVNSTIEIAVDCKKLFSLSFVLTVFITWKFTDPPENLTVSNRVVSVVEGNQPEKVTCSGKGHPALSYVWRRNSTSEPISKSHILRLQKMFRADAGSYICEATNRHGTETTMVYLSVHCELSYC